MQAVMVVVVAVPLVVLPILPGPTPLVVLVTAGGIARKYRTAGRFFRIGAAAAPPIVWTPR